MPGDPAIPIRSRAQDILKGVAIIGVLIQHAAPRDDLRAVYTPLHLGLAVPVFIVLTGMNLAGSILRHGDRPLRRLYSREYASRRLGRLVPPLAVAWLASLALGAALGRLWLTPQLLLLSLPMPGPGGYYIAVLFQAVLLVPLVAWGMARRPVVTIVACFAIDLAFELAATHIDPVRHVLFSGDAFRYDVVGLRYLAAIAVGVWLAGSVRLLGRRNLWLLPLGLAGVAYLLLEHGEAMSVFGFAPTFERRTNLLVAGLAAVYVMLALRLIGARSQRVLEPLAVLGRASYHVYLVQIVWFSVFTGVSWAAFAWSVVGCGVVGVLFERLLPGWPWSRRDRGAAQAPAEPG